MEPIPFMNLTRQYESIKEEVHSALEDVMKVTAFSGGPFVQKFEESFADWCNAKYACGVSNGTEALRMAMIALDIKEGDEVILPANTFIATVWGPMYMKATPVFVDCDPDTWEIDVTKVEEKITDKTKAIIGVHLYGQPCDMDALIEIGNKHGIPVLEDAAQGHGATYKGRTVGSLGDLACFSFYPGKNLGTFGEGGGVTTNNEAFYKKIQLVKNHASENKYYHQELGYNCRLGGMEASVLSVKLNHIDKWNNRRREISAAYQTQLTNDKVKMQKQPEWANSVYHLFVVTVDNREHFMNYLKENGVYSGMHYPVSCHLQKACEYLGYKEGDFPNAEYLAAHCVSLPMFPELRDDELAKVIEVINAY